MEDMDGYTGGCVGVMGKAMTEMVIAVSYLHLTLPTKRVVYDFVGVVVFEKKTN